MWICDIKNKTLSDAKCAHSFENIFRFEILRKRKWKCWLNVEHLNFRWFFFIALAMHQLSFKILNLNCTLYLKQMQPDITSHLIPLHRDFENIIDNVKSNRVIGKSYSSTRFISTYKFRSVSIVSRTLNTEHKPNKT